MSLRRERLSVQASKPETSPCQPLPPTAPNPCPTLPALPRVSEPATFPLRPPFSPNQGRPRSLLTCLPSAQTSSPFLGHTTLSKGKSRGILRLAEGLVTATPPLLPPRPRAMTLLLRSSFLRAHLQCRPERLLRQGHSCHSRTYLHCHLISSPPATSSRRDGIRFDSPLFQSVQDV